MKLPHWIIVGAVAEEEVGLLVAPRGLDTRRFAREMASAVSAGTPVCGRETRATPHVLFTHDGQSLEARQAPWMRDAPGATFVGAAAQVPDAWMSVLQGPFFAVIDDVRATVPMPVAHADAQRSIPFMPHTPRDTFDAQLIRQLRGHAARCGGAVVLGYGLDVPTAIEAIADFVLTMKPNGTFDVKRR